MRFNIINESTFSNKKVLFIFPSSFIGGHELMSVEIIKGIISSGGEVTVGCREKLAVEKIFSDLDVNLINLPFSAQRMEIVHAVFNIFLLKKAIDFFKKIKNLFDEVIIVQGDIELGSTYIHAARLANFKVTSYIPYAHNAKLTKKKLSIIRDPLCLFAYNWCDSYITIYNNAALEIKSKNNNANVLIIKNKVRNLDSFKLKIKKYTKDKNILKIYIIGRVYFAHKGHDRFLQSIKNIDKKLIHDIELNIIGDGPDLDKFKRLALDIEDLKVNYLGWMSEPWQEAYKADLIVIPSRFEGVPLVMLEALELGIPIIASKIDGMIDYLDDNCLCNSDTEFTEKISSHLTNFKY